MFLIALGVLLWSLLHFLPAINAPLRGDLKERFGEKKYRLLFSVAVLISIIMIVIGWVTGDQYNIYHPAQWMRPVGFLIICAGFILMGISHSPSNIKRVVRHPQLTGFLLWAIGHLMANGDNLSVALFAGMAIWSVIEIILINRRDGPRTVPEPVAFSAEIKPIAIGIVVIVVVVLLHPYLFGVSTIPQG